MELYLACKNNDNMNFAGILIRLDTIILSEVSLPPKDMHICTHIQMNNSHNVLGIPAAFLGPEETKQEGRLSCWIDDSAAKSTTALWKDFKSNTSKHMVANNHK